MTRARRVYEIARDIALLLVAAVLLWWAERSGPADPNREWRRQIRRNRGKK